MKREIIQFRETEENFEYWQKKARQEGKSFSEFLRETVRDSLGTAPAKASLWEVIK